MNVLSHTIRWLEAGFVSGLQLESPKWSFYNMSKPEEPLNEVSLNTPARKQALDPLNTISGLSFAKSGSENAYRFEPRRTHVSSKYISHHYEFISQALKQKSSIKNQIDLIHQSLSELYRIFIRVHSWDNLRLLVKRHLMVIVGLLNEGDIAAAIKEILHLYNETTYHKVRDLHGILLADCTSCNDHYLSNLKLLALQAILKNKASQEYQSSIVKFFALDHRYLLKMCKLKIHMVVQLLLNFFTVLPHFKVLFGLKFLQYLKQFSLQFETYIVNMDPSLFRKQLKLRSSEMVPECEFYLRCYYDQYSIHDTSPEKIMHNELAKEKETENFSLKILIDENKTKSDLTFLLKYKMHRVLDIVTESFNATESIPFAGHLVLLTNTWEVIRFGGLQESNNKKAFFDRTLLFLNSKMSLVEHNETSFNEILNIMAEYCIDSNQLKRLSNVVNVLFNCFVVSKKLDFLKLAAKFEGESYLKNDSKSSRPLVEKFEKFLSRVSDPRDKLHIFGYLFNFQMAGDESLGTIQTFCQNVYIRCFPKLRLTKFADFDFCSEVMMAFLYGSSPLKGTPPANWSPITRMLFSCLSGTFHLNTIEINPEPNKWHSLYKYEILIKAAYCFNIEMSKHSTLNLASIVKSYVNKWINSKSDWREKATTFEMDFLNILLEYLAFNNFDKLIVELIQCLRSKKVIYERILDDLKVYLLSAYINLQMVDNITAFKDEFNCTAFDFKSTKLEPLLQYLETKLLIVAWDRDYEVFETLFVQELPKIGEEVLDIDNNSKKTSSQYIKVILFNINLLVAASTLQLSRNNVLAAVIESKKALKLSTSLIKRSNKLSERSRLKVVHSLTSSYLKLLSLYIHIGVARDCDFYASELSSVICELNEPSVVFKCLQFLHQYYQLTGQAELAATALKKSNDTFEYIDGEFNVLALSSFFFINGEYEKLFDGLKLFFMKDIKKTSLPDYWRLKMGHVVQNFPEHYKYKTLNDINKMNDTYQRVMNQLENDPFFRSVFDSMVIIPSCHPPNELLPKLNPPHAQKEGLASALTVLPRSSNMTPKDKHIRQKFDRAAAINQLKLLKDSAEHLDLSSLKNHELSRVASFYSLALSLLSNLSIGGSFVESLVDEFALSELAKCMPLHYDKILTTVGSDIYDNFGLLPITSFTDPVKLKREKSLEDQKKLRASSVPFSVISIDFCPVTKNLLLSKIETCHDRNVHIRMPLNRTHTRDLDCMTLTFDDARRELFNIIEKSNASTSVEVTSSITTRDERKKWWQTRYELDHRLQELLNNIEVCWFNGMKGLFGPEIIEADILQDFRMKVDDVLHQNLPSRRQNGSPDMFLQVDDWIIELIMKLNPQHDDFVLMMEDLIYVILDVLLYHGEENAYDEIDVGVIHIQLEEIVKEFRPRLLSAQKISHTFLVVSSDCHMFPWESLSFLKDISVTRVPSFSILNDLIAKSNNKVSPEISLRENIAMILNPHGDLRKTESRFSDLFKEIAKKRPDSSLLINQKPDEQTFLKMVSSSNLFIYLGHGGGEQYARTREIKKFDHIAPSFLLGCSSASMGLYGKLEPTGTVYSYLLGGCCSVLGNLWDVTDKDIDKFSERVFDEIGLGCGSSDGSQEGSWISKAVSRSRDVCHLKYLNGAAPVVYGLPMRFK